MTRPTRKQLVWGLGGLLLVSMLVYGFLPDPIQVEIAVVERGAMEVVVEEEGETEAEERYVLSAPANAYLRRIDLEVGDSVGVGDAAVYLEPPRASTLDPRTRAEVEARVAAARAASRAAEERASAARAEADRAVKERDRLERLHAAGSATRQALEAAVASAVRGVADRRSAEAQVEAARADLAAAQAAVQGEGTDAGTVAPGALRSPVAGRVLAVHQRSAGLPCPATGPSHSWKP